MTEKAKTVTPRVDSSFGVKFLEELIVWWYQAAMEFKQQHSGLEDFPKVGDFLKMLETHKKLAPGDASQKELWKLLEKVRRDILPGQSSGKSPKSSARRGRKTDV